MSRAQPEGGSEGAFAQFRRLAPLIGGALLVQLAAGILSIIIPVQMALADQAPTLIGTVASSYSAGFVIGCFACPRLIRSFGYTRSLILVGMVQAALSLGFMAEDFRVWTIVRFGTGLSGAGVAIIIESWISSSASASNRGRLFSSYNVLSRLVMIAGQVVASSAFFATPAAFVMVGCLYGLSLFPIGLTATGEPRTVAMGGIALRQLWSTAPAAAIGCLYVGMVGSSLIGILPVWGVLRGLSGEASSLLPAFVLGGSLLLQWPMGYLSDRVNRRWVIAGCAGAATALSVGLMLVSDRSGSLPAILLAGMGGVTLPIYAISVAHGFDRAQREHAVGLSSSLLFCWALGSVVGPFVSATAMEWFGPVGLPVYVAFLASGSLLGTILAKHRNSDNI